MKVQPHYSLRTQTPNFWSRSYMSPLSAASYVAVGSVPQLFTVEYEGVENAGSVWCTDLICGQGQQPPSGVRAGNSDGRRLSHGSDIFPEVGLRTEKFTFSCEEGLRRWSGDEFLAGNGQLVMQPIRRQAG